MRFPSVLGPRRPQRRLRAGLAACALVLVFTAVPASSAPRLVVDLRPSPLPPASSAPRELTSAGGALFFAAFDSFAGSELWTSAGTAASTRRVLDVCPGPCASNPSRLTTAGGLVYFLAFEPAHGYELWRSDGTAAGTYLLFDAEPGPRSRNYDSFLATPNRLFFTLGQTLYASDGRREGTQRVGDFAGTFLGALGDVALFVFDDQVHGQELWRSDGTAEGTELVRDIVLGAPSALSAGELNIQAAAFGRWLLFPANDRLHGAELWRTNGTAAGTTLVRDGAPGEESSHPERLVRAEGGVYFIASGRLWWSDASSAHTVPLTAPGVAPDFSQLRPWKQQAFFAVERDDRSVELWVADGPARSARRLRTFPPLANGGRALIGGFAALADRAVLVVDHGQPRLWRSDGTRAGTVPLGQLEDPGPLASFGGRAYFAAVDGGGSELWRSDGTTGGTRRFLDIEAGDRSSSPEQLTALGSTLFFVADDGVHGPELVRSDGTQAGTFLVADFVAPLGPGDSSRPIILGALEDRLLFTLPNGELRWASSDGNHGLVAADVGIVLGARRLGDRWLFLGVGVDGEGWVIALWRSDGVSAERLREISRGGGVPDSPPEVTEFAVSGGAYYFVVDGLWRSDGTESGTQRVVADLCDGCNWVRQLVATHRGSSTPPGISTSRCARRSGPATGRPAVPMSWPPCCTPRCSTGRTGQVWRSRAWPRPASGSSSPATTASPGSNPGPATAPRPALADCATLASARRAARQVGSSRSATESTSRPTTGTRGASCGEATVRRSGPGGSPMCATGQSPRCRRS